MQTQRLERLGRQTVFAAIGISVLALAYDVLVPAKPLVGGQSLITTHTDVNGRKTICTRAEPTPEQEEHLRALGAAGYSSAEILDWLNRELAAAPPLCVELMQNPLPTAGSATPRR